MSMRPIAIAGAAIVLLLGLPTLLVAQEPGSSEPTALCSDCHEQAATFTANPHAKGKVKDGQVPNAVCESCHGDGTAHIEGGGDVEKIRKPGGREGANACLTCHDKPDGKTSHRGSVHANTDQVNCSSCHSIHTPEAKSLHLLVRPQLELCSSCHSAQASSFRNKPFSHRIGRGGMECATCHNPHGRAGKDSLNETRAGEVICLSCHSDKRGPFAYEHGGLAAGECTSCHEPHGSNNPKQLRRANVYQLCSECHSPVGGTYGSQPPSFHNLTSPRYQNCTTCHTAVHGSNRSPVLTK